MLGILDFRVEYTVWRKFQAIEAMMMRQGTTCGVVSVCSVVPVAYSGVAQYQKRVAQTAKGRQDVWSTRGLHFVEVNERDFRTL